MVQAYSYRDPDVNNSMRAYRECGKPLKELTDMDLTQMIIGTIAASEPLLSPSAAIRVADVWKFRDIDDELRRNNRARILSMKGSDLKEYGELLETAMMEGSICVVGSQEACTKLEGFEKIN